MALTLIADIGGTKNRFALAEPGGRPQRIQAIDDDDVADLEAAIARYLERAELRPSAAVLAVAGPALGDEIVLTNRPSWRFRSSELKERFGFTHLRVINDFEAIAWAVPRLSPDDVLPLGKSLAAPAGPRIVLGPGTGLGVAALLPLKGAWQVLGSEDGHAAMGPRAMDEFPIFSRLAAEVGSVSVETVLSGSGLSHLARAMDPKAVPRTPEAIVSRALAGAPSELAVVRLFVRILGRHAGDLALTFKATGGVYLAGGVGRGLGHLLEEPAFRAAFEDHPPYDPWLATIPTLLITYAEPGLLGCAAVAEQLA